MTTIFAYFLWLLTLLGLPAADLCQIADVDVPECQQDAGDERPPFAMLPGDPGGADISNGF